MKIARIQATCEVMGKELPGRITLKYGQEYFTVPLSVVTEIRDIEEDDDDGSDNQ